jgi:serine/threonine protein kinase
MIGETIGNYRLLSLLGAGGMGEVFLAEQTAIETRVAIKVLQEHVSKDAEQVHRFFNEARAVSKVRHAGTVKIFDVGFHKGRAYLVMEYLEGESLAARIRRLGTLDGEQVAEIGRQIAGVLDAVHAAGITHRDLKPDNIYLVPDAELPSGERVKVLDCGIAKLTGTLSGHSPQTRGTMGTPAYMAPEQWNNAAGVDGRADTYSLGCVMFEMAAGKPPFPANSIGEACTHHLHTPPPRISQVAPQVPPEFDALLERMLAKTLDLRPTLREVTRTFEHLRASGATQRWHASAVADPAAVTVPPTVMPRPTPIPTPTPTPYPPPRHTPGLLNPLAADASQPLPAQGTGMSHVMPSHVTPSHHAPTTMPRGEAHVAAPRHTRTLLMAGGGLVLAGTIVTTVIIAQRTEHASEPSLPVSADAAVARSIDAAASADAPEVAEQPSPRDRLLASSPFRDVFGVRLLGRQVTAADYELVMDMAPPRGGAPDAAVAWVSQREAAAFCAEIGARLPTSDEWAQAARGAWGIAVDAVAGPLQEWTATVQDDLAVVRGGHARMSRDALDRAARQRPPYFLQKEVGDASADREAIAGATIGFRCVDAVPGSASSRPGPAIDRIAPRPPAARVALGSPTVMGDVNKEVIARIARQRLGQFRACYEKQLAARPSLRGKLTVRFAINPAGVVISATATGIQGELGSCITGVIRQIKFLESGTGVVQVTYPITFG